MKSKDIIIGMRVECVEKYDIAPVGATGEVVDKGFSIGVMWDEKYPGSHSLDGKVPNNHGEWTHAEYLEPEYLELDEKEYTKILNAV